MLCGLFVFLFFCAANAQTLRDGKSTTLKASLPGNSSGIFIGSWMQTRRGRWFQAFRGIRYAQPPVGPLRFQPPQPIHQYPEPVNATVDGPACPMPVPPEFQYILDEDCLRLNVYTPRIKTSSGKLLPVIFYIHPGAFYSFNGRSDAFGPTYLLERDVVLVTINYRLGSLGFLSTGDALAPGNNGFKDQVEALRWVKRNIASFGGDPNLVTISGCSAGAYSVLLHMVSPMSKGFFHRAISVSGSPISKGPLRNNLNDLAIRQAQLLDCPTGNSSLIINCLKTKSFRELGDSLNGFFVFGFDPTILWDPIIEQDFGQERFLTEQPLHSIRGGRMHSVPFIISMTRNEFFWKAYKSYYKYVHPIPTSLINGDSWTTFAHCPLKTLAVLDNATLLRQINEDFENIARIAFILPAEGSKEAAIKLKETYFDGRQLINDTATARALGRLYGDSLIAFGVHRLANLMSRNSPESVYYYKFDYIGNRSFYENPDTGEPVGVAHQDDLLYLFSITFRFPVIPLNSPDSIMVDKMTAIWYNFARFGNPNPRSDTPEICDLYWPKMTPDKREYLRIGKDFSVQTRLFESRFQILESIYPINYGPDISIIKTQLPDFVGDNYDLNKGFDFNNFYETKDFRN